MSLLLQSFLVKTLLSMPHLKWTSMFVVVSFFAILFVSGSIDFHGHTFCGYTICQ